VNEWESGTLRQGMAIGAFHLMQVGKAVQLYEECAALLHAAADTALHSDTSKGAGPQLSSEAVTTAVKHVDRLMQLAAGVGVDPASLAQAGQQLTAGDLPRNEHQRSQHVAKVRVYYTGTSGGPSQACMPSLTTPPGL
jgi:hypothetical protein